MCRNVLIYFNETDRARVIAQLAKSVAPGGVIGLGSTEVVRGLSSLGSGWYTSRPEGQT
jgi:chemotaxis methyl-accepting protein methylase